LDWRLPHEHDGAHDGRHHDYPHRRAAEPIRSAALAVRSRAFAVRISPVIASRAVEPRPHPLDPAELVATAKLNDVDPEALLADSPRRINDHPASRLNELLPWNWRKPAVHEAAAA